MDNRWKRKITQSVLFSAFLVIICFAVKNILYKDVINIKLIDEYGVISQVRWDNQTSEYPFLGEHVYKDISMKPQEKEQEISIEIPGGHSNKLRFDFKDTDLLNKSVILKEICIQNPFKTVILYDKDIEECFYGVNGAQIQLGEEGAIITFHENVNQFIESMHVFGEVTYSRAIFEWFLRWLYLSIIISFLSINETWKLILDKYKTKIEKIIPYIISFLIAIIINITLEWIVRANLNEVFLFISKHKLVFVLEVALIWSVLLLGTFLKHWLWGIFLGVIPFAIYMIGAYFVSSMRGNMIVWQDLTALQYGVAIINNLFEIKTIHIIGAVLIFSFCLVGVYYLCHKVTWKKSKIRWASGILFALNLLIIIVISCLDIWNMDEWSPDSQLDNGCVGTLYLSFINQKIEEPSNYSQDTMIGIVKSLEEEKIESTDNKCPPNLLFLQIEAFIDPMEIEGITFSEDPIPNFRKLQELFGSGIMTVPVFGGSTVNTEFEILTGLPVTWLRKGEYPYLTYLTYDPIESISYYLDEKYETTAIHNWNGDFYNRDLVFPNIGIERYINRETMADQEFNGYYMSDRMIAKYLPKVMENSEERDLIYAITVESHGPYDSDENRDHEVVVSGNYSIEEIESVQKYVDVIHESDKSLGNIIQYLEGYEEPTVLVLYGDHQPALSLLEYNKNKYQVPYLIYSNYGKVMEHPDLNSYQLSAYLLNELELDGGIISKFHQVFAGKENYQEYLELLQYDMLNGENYISQYLGKYKKVETQIGFDKRIINGVEKSDGKFAIYGENFNQDSEVFVDGKKVSSEFVSPNILQCNYNLKDKCEITVRQKGLYRYLGEEAVYQYIP